MIKKKGFTLVELVVVVAIFGVLFIVVSGTFVNSLKGALKAEATKEVRQNGDVAMARIVHELKNARTIDQCVSATNILFTDPVTGHSMRFRANNNQLTRTDMFIGNTSEEEIADSRSIRITRVSGVSSLSFVCTDLTGPGAHVDISFDLEYVPFGNAALLNTNTRSEDLVRIPFRTTVVNRNID